MALKLLVLERLPLQLVATRCVHRSTIWRRKRKWDALNSLSPQPHTRPRAVSEQIAARILELRHKLKRCIQVIRAT